jgi:ABC-2 type transport system permease protein
VFNNVFRKTLYDMRNAMFWWSAGLFVFSVLYMLFYPSLQENMESVQSLMDRLPASIRAMAGGEIDLTSVEGYLSLRALSVYPLLTLAFAVTYGAGFIGHEEEYGTLDLLLATPTPRWRIVAEKFAALVIFTLVVLVVTYLGFVIGGLLVGAEMDRVAILGGILNMVPLTLFFAAFALALTGLRNGRGLALGLTLGVAATTYLISTMAEVTDIPRWMQRLSPWYYYNGPNVLKEGLRAGHIGLLLILTAALVGLAMWGFERRDVGV